MIDVKDITIELLPKGEFIIQHKNGQKDKGRFSMYVLDRFCQAKSIANYFELLEKIVTGMSVGDYADLVLMALQDYYRKKPETCEYDRDKVLDLLDELGGLASDDFTRLVRHAIDRIAILKKDDATASPQPSAGGEGDLKKNIPASLSETNSNNDALKQASA